MNYKELILNHSAKLIDQLLVYIIGQETVEIHFDFQEDDQWAIVSMHQYEEDLEISLRLHLNKQYDLYLGYYDEEDEFHELTHILSQDEVDLLPKGLQKLMNKVVGDEQGLRIKSEFLKQ